MSLFGHQILADLPTGAVPLWRQIMRGVSQCAFQTNEITALFLLAAVAAFNWRSAAYFAIAVAVGTIVARALNGIPDSLDTGLYGFNPGLMGLAIGLFFAPAPVLWVMVPALAAIVAAVSVPLSKVLPFPMLAAPFTVMFWILWPVSENLGLTKTPVGPFTDSDVTWSVSILNALGGAVFAGTVLSGALVILGLALSNWRHALIAVVGVVVAHAVAIQGQVEPGRINAGLLGFNAVLCTIAVYSMLGEDLRLTLFGAVGATLLIRVFTSIGLVPLAAGFLTMTWLLIFLAWLNPRFNAEPEPTPTSAIGAA